VPLQFQKLFITFLRRCFAANPDASKSWLATGSNIQHDFWLFAAPVHMQLGQDSYFLTSPAPMLVNDEEAESVVLSLNQHFSELGYHFYLQNDVWFLGVDSDPKIITTPIGRVINHDVAPHLPIGEGRLAWASFLNEIQMLLFSHPVNDKRERVGLPTINSIWFYGLTAA
jgi:hypothetical protein